MDLILLPSLSSLLLLLFICINVLFSLTLLLHHLTPLIIASSTKRKTKTSCTPSYGLVSFYRNRGRLLDWYTSLLSASPSQTILVRRLQGLRPSRNIITANPANVEHMLKANFGNYPKGEPFAALLGDLLGRGIFTSDGPLWLSQRKLASHLFSARSLRTFLISSLHSHASNHLLPSLSAASPCGFVDLQQLLHQFAFNVTCDISMGINPCSSSLISPSFASAFDVAAAVSAGRGSAPVSAIWKAKRALRIGSEKRLHDAISLIHTSIEQIIIQRRKKQHQSNNNNIGLDLLSRLVASGADDESIRDMVVSFVMAGKDTTSSALTWFFWLVMQHPEVEQKLVQEITAQEEYDVEGLKEMKYLEACLYECMRLYPPVVWDSKYAERDDVLPDGTRVEKGDRVTYFPYGMGRTERIWGGDWREFRPERWIIGGGVTTTTIRRVSAYEYPVFQAGPRVCLGKEMAFAQMKYVAAAVMSRFQMRTVEGAMPTVVPLLTAHMAGGLRVAVKER